MAFNKTTLGIVATLALTAIGAASYRAAAGTDVGALDDTIAELRDAQRLAAEWARAADQPATAAPAEARTFDWRTLRPFGARWQERKGALERAVRGLDLPSELANELAVYINALDARAEGVRHFASDDHAPAPAASAWLESTTTDNLAARANALIGDCNEFVDTKHAKAAWYKGGTAVAIAVLVASWIALLLAARPHTAALATAAGERERAIPRRRERNGETPRRLPHPPAHRQSPALDDAARAYAAETRRLREAMIAQLVAERLQAAAWRINATVAELMRAPTTARLAARVDSEASEVAALAAWFSGLSRQGGPRRAVVDVAACLDEVVAATDVGGVPVTRRSALAPEQERMEVIAVPTAIRLMLANLLDNAACAVRLAHRRPASEGRVAISCAIDGNQLVVTVMDNGIGMTAPQRERAFLPFCSDWPHDSPTGASGPVGMGCGLAIAAKLVDDCGGTIALGSPPSGGTVAQIRLPLANDWGQPDSRGA